MTKELEAYRRICIHLNYKDDYLFNGSFNEDDEIIETALKNYQELLERPCVLVGRTNGHTKALIDMISKNYKEIKITSLEDEKELKALEIIKKKKVNFYEIEFTENYEEYAKDFTATNIHSIVNRFMLTQEEYYLLKEVLL